MVKKNLKIAIIVLIILGILFSISNFLIKKVNAGASVGKINVSPCGIFDRMRKGNKFDIGLSVLEDKSKRSTTSNKIFPKKKATLRINIKVEKIEFSSKLLLSQLILEARAFCVTEDELFIIPDYRAGNIKIYKINEGVLGWVNTIGQKGYGPGEISKPKYCFYEQEGNKFVVMDMGTKKILIYDRLERNELKLVKEISCRRGGTDIQLKNGKLFISGYAADRNRNTYHFYYIDLTNDQKTFLLPSYQKFGFKSRKEYEAEFKKIVKIGIGAWFDIQGNGAYFVWEGNLKVIKLNILSREIYPNYFGKKPPHYFKPEATKTFLALKSNIKNSTLFESKKTTIMFYVRDIFATPKYVLVIYEGPIKQDKKSNFWIQFYTLNGDFIKEVSIPGKPDRRMWLDKERDILYSLSSQSDKDSKYFILKYTIFE